MRTRRILAASLLVTGLVCMLGLGLLPTRAQADLKALPPRPPTATPTSIVRGASIVLELTFGDDWPDRGWDWQELWTVVEWQDEDGDWHVVEGWQGTLNEVTVKGGVVIGQKAWWVAEANLGSGPFRWLVYHQQDGALLAASETFDLPDSVGELVAVDVSLEELNE